MRIPVFYCPLRLDWCPAIPKVKLTTSLNLRGPRWTEKFLLVFPKKSYLYTLHLLLDISGHIFLYSAFRIRKTRGAEARDAVLQTKPLFNVTSLGFEEKRGRKQAIKKKTCLHKNFLRQNISNKGWEISPRIPWRCDVVAKGQAKHDRNMALGPEKRGYWDYRLFSLKYISF